VLTKPTKARPFPYNPLLTLLMATAGPAKALTLRGIGQSVSRHFKELRNWFSE
jgi:hypothetical protein